MRLLLIEDDKELSRVLVLSLRREKYVVDTAEDGINGYKRAKSTDYDIIILDLALPKRDGREVCRDLRKDGVTTPILVLTGRDAFDSRVKLLDLGADDYLVKPFSSEELFARLRVLLRRPAKQLRVTLTYDKLELDPQTRQVTFDKKPIQLTPKEFSLLEYMLRHPDTVLTREALLKHVWGVDGRHSSNRLDVYIKHLRRKIDGPFKITLIHTMRGVGYLFGTLPQ